MLEAARKSILVVDDAPENIDVLKSILAPHYTVKAATSGATALMLASSPTPPDLILLDVVMPQMSGLDVCRALKADPKTHGIPVIFVTAITDKEDEAFGFSLGASDYLTKPVNAPVVLARVRTHLALYEHSRHLEILVTERTAALQKKSSELEATQLAIIQRLARAAEFRDNETGLHVIRFSKYARLLAKMAGLSDTEADQMMNASLMHDVGKIGIPDNILLKPGKLSAEEFEVIKQHPGIGAEIIGSHDSKLLQLASIISLTHHEKWDGSGYPNGLRGEAIPLAGRICAIADVYDALTSVRPYKDAWSADDAFAYLSDQAGKSLDPHLVGVFAEMRPAIEEISSTFREPTVE
jgi:putative two-component system response regulator